MQTHALDALNAMGVTLNDAGCGPDALAGLRRREIARHERAARRILPTVTDLRQWGATAPVQAEVEVDKCRLWLVVGDDPQEPDAVLRVKFTARRDGSRIGDLQADTLAVHLFLPGATSVHGARSRTSEHPWVFEKEDFADTIRRATYLAAWQQISTRHRLRVKIPSALTTSDGGMTLSTQGPAGDVTVTLDPDGEVTSVVSTGASHSNHALSQFGDIDQTFADLHDLVGDLTALFTYSVPAASDDAPLWGRFENHVDSLDDRG